MNVLVFGGSGFIGRRIVEKLLLGGDQVWSVSRNPWADDAEHGDSLKRIPADIRNYADVVKAFSVADVDVAIHVAYALTAEGEADPHKAAETNVMGTMNIYEAARIAGVRRIIFCSSIAAYAPPSLYGDRPVTEDETLMRPVSIYGATKVLNEFMADRFEQRYGTETVSVRISAVYGTAREDRGVTAWTSKMVAGAVAGVPVALPMRPDQLASFIYVDDSAEQIVRLAHADTLRHRIYNSGGVTSTPEAFAAVVKKHCPGADIRFDPSAPRWPYPHQVDGSRLQAEIGFTVRSPEDGLLQQINQERAARKLAPIEIN